MQTTAEPPARLHNSCMLHKDRAASHEATLNRSQNTTYNFHFCGKKHYSINVSQRLTLSLCVCLDFSIYWRSSIRRFCVSSVVKSQRRCTWCLIPLLPTCAFVCLGACLCTLRAKVFCCLYLQYQVVAASSRCANGLTNRMILCGTAAGHDALCVCLQLCNIMTAVCERASWQPARGCLSASPKSRALKDITSTPVIFLTTGQHTVAQMELYTS